VAAGVANWRFTAFFIPFYYFGHCLSYLNGYYLHYGGKPDVPLAREQAAAGTRVIIPPHALGFLDPNLPKWRTVQPPLAAER
jgi:hypothetical protein